MYFDLLISVINVADISRLNIVYEDDRMFIDELFMFVNKCLVNIFLSYHLSSVGDESD